MENTGACVSVDVSHVSGVMELVMRAAGRPVVVRDFEKGAVRQVEAGIVAAPDGLLPVFLAAGEAIWHEVTGGGFDLGVERDDGALTGYRVTRISACGSRQGERVAIRRIRAKPCEHGRSSGSGRSVARGRIHRPWRRFADPTSLCLDD
jgi:hypothetical protein